MPAEVGFESHKKSVHEFYEGLITQFQNEVEEYKTLYLESQKKIDELQKLQERYTGDASAKQVITDLKAHVTSLKRQLNQCNAEKESMKSNYETKITLMRNKYRRKLKRRQKQPRESSQPATPSHSNIKQILTPSVSSRRFNVVTPREQEMFAEIDALKSSLKSRLYRNR